MQVLIVDSDSRSAEILRSQLGEITDGEIVIVDKTSMAAFDVEEGTLQPDICFIDLRPEGDSQDKPTGIALAQKLQLLIPGIQIIFTSSCDDFYLQAYEADHVFFLRKPVDAVLLRKGWSRAMERQGLWASRYFSFRFARKTYRIPAREILYIEKDRRRMIIHTRPEAGGEEVNHYFYGTMDDALRQLDQHFIRCHNSYIVNLARVGSWSRGNFTIGQQKIPISRQYAKAAKAAFLDAKNG